MLSTLRPLFLVMALVALVAACSSGGGSSAAPSVAAPSEAAPSEAAPSDAAPSEPASGGGDATVVLADNTLGQILTGADGMTLYGFTPDADGVPTCYDDCAAAWPPLLVDDAAAAAVGDGLDAGLLSTVDRTDGTKQVKYGDWPLYYFASDAAAGDASGQGVGEKWFVVTAAGELIGG